MKESYKILVTHLSFQFALRGILQIADVTCCVNQNVLFFLYLCAELNLAYLSHSMHCHNMAVKRLLVEQYFATFLTFSIFVITVFFLHVSVKVTVRLVSSSTYWAKERPFSLPCIFHNIIENFFRHIFIILFFLLWKIVEINFNDFNLGLSKISTWIRYHTVKTFNIKVMESYLVEPKHEVPRLVHAPSVCLFLCVIAKHTLPKSARKCKKNKNKK